jgi:hypothetical protein
MGVGVQNAEYVVLNLEEPLNFTGSKKLTENRSLSVRSRDIYLKKLKPLDAKKVCFRLNRNFFEI